jgi:hypothetical protein
MQVYRRGAAALGILLVAPLVGAVAWSVGFTATCEYDCGDQGGRGLFLLVLLCTPPAAAGLYLLTAMGSAEPGRLASTVRRLLVAAVVFCVLVLSGFAIAADIGALNRLTGGGPSYASDDEDIFMIVVAVVLTAIAITAVFALRAAWRSRR